LSFRSRSLAISSPLIVIPFPRARTSGVVINGLMGLIGIAFGLPLLWLLLASFDSGASWRIRWPNFTLENFRAVLSAQGIQPFVNSFYLAAVTATVATTLAFLAAYPLSRRHVPGARVLMLLVLFAAGLPVTMMLVPIYQMYATLHWLDSNFTTSLFLAATALPFAIWLLKNYMDAIPRELEEAAGIEGAGTLRVLGSIVFPLVLPGLSVTAVYNFIAAWGAFVVPLVLDSNPDDQPGTVAIYQFLGSHGMIQFGPLSAFSLLFSLPIVILYMLIARRFRGGFAFKGGVRG
jgi:multiple sugar transport system permease protein